MRDFYAVLGLNQDATSEQIRDAYRRKVREHHPDANPQRREEAERTIKLVFEAYATLSDPEKRRLHDWDLANHALRGSQAAPAPGTAEAPAAEWHTSAPPLCLIRKVREVLKISMTDMAHQLGLSEAMLQQLESRDGVPQGMIQLRTFTHLVETAARQLEQENQAGTANGLRNALQRKKNQRAIFR